MIYESFRIECVVIYLYFTIFSNKFYLWLIDDVTSDVIDPRGYHNENLHVIRNRKRGHLPMFALINIIITRSGWLRGGRKSEKGKNITKMFASKNYSHGPIFMHNAQKTLKLAPVLIFFGKKLHFLGGRIGLTRSKTAKMLNGPYLILLWWRLKAEVKGHRETELQRRSNIFSLFPLFRRGHAWGDFFLGIIRWHGLLAIIWA